MTQGKGKGKIEICMAPVKTGDRSDLIYSPARKYGLIVVRVEIDVVSPSRKEC